MQRPSWKNRGKNFSDLGVQIDCGKLDLTTVKNVLHFVTTGTCKFMFNVGKELFFIPVVMVLKCLSNQSDKQIFDHLIAGKIHRLITGLPNNAAHEFNCPSENI